VVVPAYTLALDELNAIAAGAGLSWVNSDAEKVRVVQEAIAAEPKPVHVPRERPPVVVLDEGPLVLVETRKDLSQVTLPFDAPRSLIPRAPKTAPRGRFSCRTATGFRASMAAPAHGALGTGRQVGVEVGDVGGDHRLAPQAGMVSRPCRPATTSSTSAPRSACCGGSPQS
jgi:hypothetical protein